jgi:NADH dehydrogenase
VLGGGFSGVEVAGHLFDLAKSVRRYYQLAPGVEPRMILVQRGDRIIPELQHESLSAFALKKLQQNGVEVLLKTSVREVSKTEVHLTDGRRLNHSLLVVTVGNAANGLVRDSQLPLERQRLKTAGTMQVEGHDHIWALGDCALVVNAFDQKPSPPTAQFALRQAKQLAGNIRRSREGTPLVPFRFRPQGLLASIGQRNGVAEVYGVKFSGIIAWFFWRAVYFMKMPTFSRKLSIAVDWMMDAIFTENLVRAGGREIPQIRREHYVAGDVVYRQGEPSRTLYLIEKGVATVHVDGNVEPVTLRQGEHFGLSAVEQQQTMHSTTVTANSALDLIAFDRPWEREFSQDMLNRELLQLLERRHLRNSWHRVVERFPEIDNLRVRDAMVSEPEILRPSDTLEDALAKLSTAVNLPVVNASGQLVGVCGRTEVNQALAKGVDASSPVTEFASQADLTLAPHDTLRHATSEYLRSGQDFAPVVDDKGRLAGMFGLVEAARVLLRDHVGAARN